MEYARQPVVFLMILETLYPALGPSIHNTLRLTSISYAACEPCESPTLAIYLQEESLGRT
jgi:hypothetical protein